ncbi:MAG TPA: hypothetical protein VKQ71_05870, partial [Acidimicrobiales bacterium]|nr:hypothetical protein [Acidimicrobiales bacterium]
MRRLYKVEELVQSGFTRSAIRWGERVGRWRRVEAGVYAHGPEEPTELDRARAAVLVSRGAASGHLAAVLLRLDAVELRGVEVTVHPSGNGRRHGVRRRAVPSGRLVVVEGIPCTDGLQTLVDLAAD